MRTLGENTFNDTQGAATMFKTSLTSFATAALIAATHAPAPAQTVAFAAHSPITIASFRVNELYSPGTVGTEVEEPPQFIASDVAVHFVNTANVAATVVKFSVADGQFTKAIVDKGIFTHGVQIKHHFAIANPVGSLANVVCNVTDVDFADGSSWHAAGNETGVHSDL
ncbi:MAG: hypothetical protein ABSB70_18290 [Candidatus Velthaea sp.]